MNSQRSISNAQKLIGQNIPRLDAYNKVTGKENYPGDLVMEGMKHLKVRFAERPHAKIKKIDCSRAMEVPGVVTILTGDDVPVNEYGLAFNDQPVLCDTQVRFEGDQVCLVVADTEASASKACRMIDIEYENLPILSDPREAMAAGSFQLHENTENNILEHFPVRRGDVERGFEEADVIVSGSYYLPMQEHIFMQPESGMAYMDGDMVVVETAGQGADHDRKQIAHALGLPLERIRVIYRAIGGAFGGREDISVQIILALAAYKTGYPVKIIWSRTESIRGHCKRHQMYINTRWGAKNNGEIVAVEAEIVQDAGAYAYASTMVLGKVVLMTTGAYEIPNVKIDGYAVYTNNIPGGAMRGFGCPQGIFTAEMQIEKIAERLGMDSVTLRKKNLLHEGSLLSVGSPIEANLDLETMLDQCVGSITWPTESDKPGKKSAANRKTDHFLSGVGVAIGLKNVGFGFGSPDTSSCQMELNGDVEIDEAIIRYAGAECGQGLVTVLSQIAADALSIPIEKVRWRYTDTDQTPESGGASAARLTLVGGHAVIGAAKVALEDWQNESRPAIGDYTYTAPETTNYDPKTGYCKPNYAYSPVAQAVELEVDSETGEINIKKVVTVIDAGKAVNPKLIEGQVEGSVSQGIGYAILEDFRMVEGATLTPNLATYLIPTSVDMPPISETIILEYPDPVGPGGVRGIGETPILTMAPAIAAAVHQATGIWFDQLPMTPEKILSQLIELENAA